MQYSYHPIPDRLLQETDAAALADMRAHLPDTMRLHAEAVPYLAFPAFEALPFLKHGFSTRFGGVSSGEFAAMNLFYKNDGREQVLENYRRFCRSLGILPENLVFTAQEHTANVRVVTKEDCGKGYCRERDYTAVDALITNEPDVALTVFGADCVPILLAEKNGRAIGTVHAGWRGTAEDIAGKTVKAMQEAFGVRAEDLLAGIGPSICKDCYEIDETVAGRFFEAFPAKLLEGAVFHKENGRCHLDLWQLNMALLQRAGLKKEHIYPGYVCTCHEPMNQYLFSHRAANGKRGGMAGVIVRKKRRQACDMREG